MISVEHLTKYYGDHLAVDDLSFEIGEGHVYGFLGPNGAGKSTTMNIMTGCLSATEGRVRIGGFDIFEQPLDAKRLIGYLPEQPPLYMNDTPLEYLRFVGQAKGLRGAALNAQIDEVIRKTGIEQVCRRRISTLSKGYRQRVGIAQALLGDPKVIILDEPTVGLDPLQIIEIRELIRSLGETHTVIFSSHILSEVQTICDQVLIIAHGRLVAFDTPENLEQKLTSANTLTVSTDADEETARRILESVAEITELTCEPGDAEGTTRLRIRTSASDLTAFSRAVSLALAQSGSLVLELRTEKANLEDIFIELTETREPDGAEEAPEEQEEEKQ